MSDKQQITATRSKHAKYRKSKNSIPRRLARFSTPQLPICWYKYRHKVHNRRRQRIERLLGLRASYTNINKSDRSNALYLICRGIGQAPKFRSFLQLWHLHSQLIISILAAYEPIKRDCRCRLSHCLTSQAILAPRNGRDCFTKSFCNREGGWAGGIQGEVDCSLLAIADGCTGKTKESKNKQLGI
ncbi:hypothetical protein BJX99DRAFT_44539 [Aspergillus californicus]